MSHDLSIGFTGLRTAKVGIDLVGQNIANANTPGYHRQLLRLSNRPSISVGGSELGTGVQVHSIERVRSELLEMSLLHHSSDAAFNSAQLGTAMNLESLMSTGEGSLPDQFNHFFSRLEELSARPHDQTARRDVVRAADELSQSFVGLSSDLSRLRTNMKIEAEAIVNQVNELSSEVNRLNQQINITENQGRSANDLRDKRDSLHQELAGYLNLTVDPRADTASLAGGAVLLGLTVPPTLVLRETADGVSVFREDLSNPIKISSGQLGALIADINETLPDTRASLDSLANAFITSINEHHSRGVGLNGGLTHLTSVAQVYDSADPLSSFVGGESLSNGTLPITVLDQATGTRTLHEVSIDINVDTLDSLATKLSVANISASVSNNQLIISADSGYSFDFSGLPGATADTPAADDGTGLLNSLGLNTFFQGNSAANIGVTDRLLESHSHLATSITGEPGDSDNLTAMIAQRWQTNSSLSDLTPEQYLADITAGVGSDVASLQRTGEGLESVTANLNSQITGLSGVDPDEEMLKMIEYQRAFEASARFISIINETNDELMRLI